MHSKSIFLAGEGPNGSQSQRKLRIEAEFKQVLSGGQMRGKFKGERRKSNEDERQTWVIKQILVK